MNLPKEQLESLLKLFPVATLKLHFNVKSTNQEHLIREIISGSNTKDILDFAVLHFDYAKQHIHFYESDTRINVSSLQLINSINSYSNQSNNKKLTATFFVPYSVNAIEYLGSTAKQITISSTAPVQLQYHEQNNVKILTIKAIILERFSSSGSNRKVFITNKGIDESDIIKSIISDCEKNKHKLSHLDITKGVKDNFINDLIDFPSIKFTTSLSTITETMHENFTIKAKYPQKVPDIMQNPLDKTICKFINPNPDFVDHFRVEPSIGFISFNTYPPTLNSNPQIISMILDKNF
ncbi:hypothetical protein ACWA1C_08375 [Flectobacillus roseus]